MKCPYCGHHDSKVIDSRDVEGGVRRRRQCEACERRFTTYERVQAVALLIIKKDGRREEYNREKLTTGIRKACEKRPLPSGAIERAVDDIEAELHRLGRAEVPSRTVGDLVMEHLKELDHIAYIRFASVYREFRDLEDVRREMEALTGATGDARPSPDGQLPLLAGARASPVTKRGRNR